MKNPQKPPKLSELLTETSNSSRMGEVFSFLSVASNVDRYEHWDKIRFKTPPSNLTHREWWLILKLSRKSALKSIELYDRSKNPSPFQFAVPDLVQKELHLIDLSSGGNVGIPPEILNSQTRDRYLISSLIHEAITSSQLEGAITTREVAKEMIKTGRQPRDDSEQMILNNYLTMQNIRKLKSTPLTPDLLFQIHRMVTIKTLKDETAAGRFRRADEDIYVGDDFGEVFHNPPPSNQLQDRLTSMCAFANGESPKVFVHPVVRAIILHFWLAYDHPFVDGNGRTARALFYWAMLKSGYWLFEYISISDILKKSPSKYGRSFLYTETDENDLTYFIIAQTEVIRKSIEALHNYIQKKTDEIREFQSNIRAIRFFNHRQSALLTHALKHAGHIYTFKSHKESHNITYQTARTDLLDLSSKGILELEKQSREFFFRAPNDLTNRLINMTKK